MLSQVLREKSIEKGEKELDGIFNGFQISRQTLHDKLIMSGQQDLELKQLFDLTENMGIKKREFDIRREHLQNARNNFLQTLTLYEGHLSSEMSNIKEMNGQFKRLIEKMEYSNNSENVKPAMIDKEIQVIPESTLLKSPSVENLNPVRPLALTLPASPILRTSSRKVQQTFVNGQIADFKTRLDFN